MPEPVKKASLLDVTAIDIQVIRKRQSQPFTKQPAKPPVYPIPEDSKPSGIITSEFAIKSPDSLRRFETLNLTTKMDTLRNSKDIFRGSI